MNIVKPYKIIHSIYNCPAKPKFTASTLHETYTLDTGSYKVVAHIHLPHFDGENTHHNVSIQNKATNELYDLQNTLFARVVSHILSQKYNAQAK